MVIFCVPLFICKMQPYENGRVRAHPAPQIGPSDCTEQSERFDTLLRAAAQVCITARASTPTRCSFLSCESESPFLSRANSQMYASVELNSESYFTSSFLVERKVGCGGDMGGRFPLEPGSTVPRSEVRMILSIFSEASR